MDCYVLRLSFEHQITIEDEEESKDDADHSLVIAVEILEVEQDAIYCVDFRLQGCKLKGEG
jgi:hypothetical protein